MKQLLLKFTNLARRMPKDVKETKRTILFENKNVSVVCFQWKKGQGLPEHDHFGNCLFKVLEGTIIEQRMGHKKLMKQNDVGEITKGIKHAIFPLENSKSLHIYSPPPPNQCNLK